MSKIIGITLRPPSSRMIPVYKFVVASKKVQLAFSITKDPMPALHEIESYLINMTPFGEWDRDKPIGEQLHATTKNYCVDDTMTRYELCYFDEAGTRFECNPVYERE